MSKRRYIHLLQKFFDQIVQFWIAIRIFIIPFSFLLLPTNRFACFLKWKPHQVYPSLDNQYIYIHTHVSSHKRQPISIGAWTLVHACACTCHLSLSLSLFTLLTKYGRSGGGSSLSVATRGKQSKRPSVESGQPVCPPAVERERERERPALVPSLATFLLSLSLSLSLSFCNLCPTYMHPSVSFQTAPLPTAPRVSRPFTYRSPMQRGMNGTRRVERFTYDQLFLSFSLRVRMVPRWNA